MHTILLDTSWLEACSLEIAGGLGGQTDIDLESGDRYYLRAFPDETGHSKWVIEFTLKGHQPVPDRALAFAFLRGSLPSNKIRLSEFVLYYPASHGGLSPDTLISERFTGKGVGLKVR